MTIEELFGTLQQSVVSTWRKHLRSAKYSKHMALDEFYTEMPEKVDALIEAWMGVNGRKVKSYDNVLQSKNMNTLSYLKELKSVVKQGYPLMNGEKELEALLDDIAELIDSTLYKVKELSESRMKNLTDFITESLLVMESNTDFLDDLYLDNWGLADIFHETNGGAPAQLKKIDWYEYFEGDEEYIKDIVKFFTTFFKAIDYVQQNDLGYVHVGDLETILDSETREAFNIDEDAAGFAVWKDGDDATWTIFTLVKEYDKLPKPQRDALDALLDKYENIGYQIEWFYPMEEE